jgi:epoxide hydrolase 4
MEFSPAGAPAAVEDSMTAATGAHLTHRQAIVNGVRLHYVEAGHGSLVVLLHGFPEFWYSWRLQIPALAEAGFRVIAPDMRGYNLSEKPPGIASYAIERLADDVRGLVHHAGERRAAVVGHDWGGGVAWYTPMRHPELVTKLAVLNAPHPAAFAREIRSPAQALRSWYMFFFQLPGLPEAGLRAGNFRVLDQTLRRDPVRPDAFSEADIRRYKRAMGRPGALTASINYYRAMIRRGPAGVQRLVRRIDVPTLLIWGERDRYLGPKLTEGLDEWVPDLRVERIPDASHWVQIDAPERVNRLLIDFLRRSSSES